MTEHYLHPIDPRTILFNQSEGMVFARGRDQFQNQVFAHIENGSDFAEAKQLAQEREDQLKNRAPGLFGNNPRVLLGCAIDAQRTRLWKKLIYDHHSVGVWVSVRNKRLIRWVDSRMDQRRNQ